jgi:hypothetical protein
MNLAIIIVMSTFVQGKSRVCGSSTCVVVCLAGMWLYERCVLFALQVCGFMGDVSCLPCGNVTLWVMCIVCLAGI